VFGLMMGSGGGVGSCWLTNCVVSSNSAASGGGAAGSMLWNCLLTGNTASLSGGGAGYGGGSVGPCLLVNCTVVGNSAGSFAGGIESGRVADCVVYFNSAPADANYTASFPEWSHSCTVPLPDGDGNFTNPPLFVDQARGDFRLQSNSPCINAGNNDSGSTDLDGNPRVRGGTEDVGAYECQTPSSVISYAWLQQYGLPIDGTADSSDADNDQMTNWQEWIAGTDPTNSTSSLKLLAPVSIPDSPGVAVTWQSVSGKTYYLQRGMDLLSQPAFSSIESNIVGEAGTTTFADTNATGIGPYFYRVGVQ
jgi:hypothetical protein